LSKSFGVLKAVQNVSFEVWRGEIVNIIGPNGAGKTTLFKAVSGQVVPAAGRIVFGEHDLLTLPAKGRAHLGIAHVPEGRQVVNNLFVLENLRMRATTAQGRADWSSNLDSCFSLFPVLAERRSQLAGTLSGGEQQMLAIARGLASSPRLLMLDEPSMGLAPIVVDMIFERIHDIHRDRKLTIVLVEQRVVEALELCDWAHVLDVGRCVTDGPPAQLMKDERIKQAYLGLP